ncbi:MAG TPA: 3-isopropylmalate dehydratase small subunit [Actinobacteria bacterium]|nr:3-isopropylmalate dehydratase small subunit [Actinomycetota bacterium]
MKISGTAYKVGRDIDTDIIIPAQHLTTFDPDELAGHCMEPLDPGFPEKVKDGGIIVADENFGCGSSREHAPIALKGAGIGAVIAKSFARIFYRNAINTGLPIFESAQAVDGIEAGHDVSVDMEAGTVENLTTGQTYKVAPFPKRLAHIIEAGGLIEHTRRRIASK